jgi:transcription antitermination factor NusA-like protein
MSAVPDDLDDLLDDLPDELPAPKGKAAPLRRPKAVSERQEKAAELAAATTAAQNHAQRLAQIVNLHIAGYSLAQIGLAIGASEAEVDRMLSQETARYVKNQPALRSYVRNYLSSKYTALLDAVWDDATNKTSKVRFEAQDRSLRILKEMGNLHGAAAPTQTEIKVESTPESVERIVAALAAGQGLAYDDNIFDTVPGEVVHAAAVDATDQLAVSGNAVEESDGHDEF